MMSKSPLKFDFLQDCQESKYFRLLDQEIRYQERMGKAKVEVVIPHIEEG